MDCIVHGVTKSQTQLGNFHIHLYIHGIGLWRRLSAEELMLLNCGVGEDSWESLGLQGDPTSRSEGDQPWDFFGRNDAKAETPVLWPPHAKSCLIGKDSDAGRDWGQEEKGTTEDEMAGWHHWLDGRESQWTPGVGDGQGGPACCDSWGRKELDTTERLNWSDWSDTTEIGSKHWLGKLWRKQCLFPFVSKGEKQHRNTCLLLFLPLYTLKWI